MCDHNEGTETVVPTAAPPVGPNSEGAMADNDGEPVEGATAISTPVPQQTPAANAVYVPPADPFIVFAIEIKRRVGIGQARLCNLKTLLKSGALEGRGVEVRGKGGQVLLKGVFGAHGMVECLCKQCPPNKSYSCSGFEAHSGSTAHRPAEFIYLSEFGKSLKDVCATVAANELDAHSETCGICNECGDLLCCDGCPMAFHTTCLNMEAVPEGDWFCKECKAAAATRTAKKSNTARRSTASKRDNSGSTTGTGRAPKRLRMMAPTINGFRVNGRGNGSRNKMLFTNSEGALKDGQRVLYMIHGQTLLHGTVRIGAHDNDPCGIECDCCSRVISCSSFEAHAGYANRRAPYDNIYTEEMRTLRKVAEAMPLYEQLMQLKPGEENGNGDMMEGGCDDGYVGGCTLCYQHDFQKGDFGERTIILCDQCEREYHVGCLRERGMQDLKHLPEGDWFCSEQCRRVNEMLLHQVAAGDTRLTEEHSWQLLRGEDGKADSNEALKTVHEILRESFDPIIDSVNDVDLMPLMIYCKTFKDWDYSGCYTLLLRHNGNPVAAATMRCFGSQLAELPLIATKLNARRQGHARVLMDALEKLLAQAGVAVFSLPAAHETVKTWINGFGFQHMPIEQVLVARSELRILIFPGTEVLYKYLGSHTAETAMLKPREQVHGPHPVPHGPSAQGSKEESVHEAAAAAVNTGPAVQVGAAAEAVDTGAAVQVDSAAEPQAKQQVTDVQEADCAPQDCSGTAMEVGASAQPQAQQQVTDVPEPDCKPQDCSNAAELGAEEAGMENHVLAGNSSLLAEALELAELQGTLDDVPAAESPGAAEALQQLVEAGEAFHSKPSKLRLAGSAQGADGDDASHDTAVGGDGSSKLARSRAHKQQSAPSHRSQDSALTGQEAPGADGETVDHPVGNAAELAECAGNVKGGSCQANCAQGREPTAGEAVLDRAVSVPRELRMLMGPIVLSSSRRALSAGQSTAKSPKRGVSAADSTAQAARCGQQATPKRGVRAKTNSPNAKQAQSTMWQGRKRRVLDDADTNEEQLRISTRKRLRSGAEGPSAQAAGREGARQTDVTMASPSTRPSGRRRKAVQ